MPTYTPPTFAFDFDDKRSADADVLIRTVAENPGFAVSPANRSRDVSRR